MEELPKSKYTEAQKRATKKYRENNKDKVNQQRKIYYQSRKNKDPAFLEYKRIKAKEYYTKKKELKKNTLDINEIPKDEVIDEVKPLETIIEEVKEDIIEVPVIDETIQEKKIRKYNKKNKTI